MSKCIYVVDEEAVEAYPHIFTIGLTALSEQIYSLTEEGLVILKHPTEDVDDYNYDHEQLTTFILGEQMNNTNCVSRRQFTKQSLGLMTGASALGGLIAGASASASGVSFGGSNKAETFLVDVLPPLPPYMKQNPRLDKVFLHFDSRIPVILNLIGDKNLDSIIPDDKMYRGVYYLKINNRKRLGIMSSGMISYDGFLNPEDEQYVLTRFRMKYPQVDVHTAVRPYLYVNCHTTNIAYEINKSPLFDKNEQRNVVVVPSDSISKYKCCVDIPRNLLTLPKAEGFAILNHIQSLANSQNQGWMHVFM